jgi:hypothetical protein
MESGRLYPRRGCRGLLLGRLRVDGLDRLGSRLSGTRISTTSRRDRLARRRRVEIFSLNSMQPRTIGEKTGEQLRSATNTSGGFRLSSILLRENYHRRLSSDDGAMARCGLFGLGQFAISTLLNRLAGARRSHRAVCFGRVQKAEDLDEKIHWTTDWLGEEA